LEEVFIILTFFICWIHSFCNIPIFVS
jgi:hypothetical protein